MRIDFSNCHVLNSNEINIHDDVLCNMHFDREKGELRVRLQKPLEGDREYEIKFSNVIGVSISACNFWGRSPHVLDFEYVEPNEQVLFPKLEHTRRERHPQCKLQTGTVFIETVMTFISGDVLNVVCEAITWEQ